MFYKQALFAGVLLLKPPPSTKGEHTLRSVKSLIEVHRLEFGDGCTAPTTDTPPAIDHDHEDLAVRISFLYEDAAKLAIRLNSERGQSAAVYQYMDAAYYRLQAHACKQDQKHLEHASKYVDIAIDMAETARLPESVRAKLQNMRSEISATLDTLSERTQELAAAQPVTRPPPDLTIKAPAATLPQPDRPRPRSPRTHAANKADRVGLAVSASLTGVFLGVSLGMGLSRIREPFEGSAHRAIHDAAVASWNSGSQVPYSQGVDICQKGKELHDAGVMDACSTFHRLGRATIATSILAGVSLVSTTVFTVRVIRARTRDIHLSGAWQPGGAILKLVGHF